MAIRLTPTEVAKADRYGAAEFRSRAAFARLMFLRGMAAYEREYALGTDEAQCDAIALHRHADAFVG
ncbi:hypothetical protein C2U69_33050 [Cupriavidus pinatubonensis]|nr:hypothetical protein C2U69_33050 [Cupriavidus pinatubonensis]